MVEKNWKKKKKRGKFTSKKQSKQKIRFLSKAKNQPNVNHRLHNRLGKKGKQKQKQTEY